MSAQSNVAPVIIKKKKVVKGGGHHGGAWKVAYADFVTAMMAFFMLMWLLNATTEKQRKGLADYFSPSIAIARVSGGGEGALGGDSVFSEEALPQSGTGASSKRPTIEEQARGATGTSDTGDRDELDAGLAAIQSALEGRGGESHVMENALRHVITRVTDEGLVIDVFALEDAPLFEEGTDIPTPLLRELANMIAGASRLVTNPVGVGGFVRSDPIVLAHSPVWELSAMRAGQMRLLLEGAGMSASRVHRVTGHANRKPAVPDPMAVRNDRLEVTLLRTKFE